MTSLDLHRSDVATAFKDQARKLLKTEYLPKIEKCVRILSDEQVWWRANPESNSVGNLMLHLAGNARQWIVCGLGGATDKRARDAEFAARSLISSKELFARLTETVAEVDGVLSSFEISRMLERFVIQGTEVTALQAIFHVTEHFSMHTGQIILLTKIVTKQDLAFYDFSTGVPVAKW